MTAPSADSKTRPTPTRPKPTPPPPPPKPATPSKASLDDRIFVSVDELRADLACAVAPVPSIGRAELGAWSVTLSELLAALGDRDPWLRFRLSLARRRVDELLKAPARRDADSARSLGIATSGGPVGPPADTGKGPAPGPAVAGLAAACGSDGSLVASVAGASFLPLRPAVPLGVGPLYDALPAPVGAR